MRAIRSRRSFRSSRSSGQGASESMLVISVVAVTIVAAAGTMVPFFRDGVQNLGSDVSEILLTGAIGGNGGAGGAGGAGGGNPVVGGQPGALPSDVAGAIEEVSTADNTRNGGPTLPVMPPVGARTVEGAKSELSTVQETRGRELVPRGPLGDAVPLSPPVTLCEC